MPQPITVPQPRSTASPLPITPTQSRSSNIPTPIGPIAPPQGHVRRPSLPMSPSLLSTSPRSVPVPVPQRHPSLSLHHRRPSLSGSNIYESPAGNDVLGRSSSLRSSSPGVLASPRRGHQKGSSSIASSGSSNFNPGSVPSGFLNADTLARNRSERRKSNVETRRPEVRRSVTRESLASQTVTLREDDGKWLDITAKKILEGRGVVEGVQYVKENMEMEGAVEGSNLCLVVEKRSSFAFFDYADLNTFLLLVLHATSGSPNESRGPSRSASMRGRKDSGPGTYTSPPPSAESAIIDEPLEPVGILDERSKEIVKRLGQGEKVAVGSVCDISGKDPYHSFPIDTPLRTLLPLFASGLHKIALTSPTSPHPIVLTDTAVIEHLISLPPETQPATFELPVTSPTAAFPLHPLISLPGTSSVLDAMQVMSMHGLSALGVLSGPGAVRDVERNRRESSGSSGSSSGSVFFRSPSQTALNASPMVSPAMEMSTSPFDAMGTGIGGGELLSVVTVNECARLVVPSEGKQVLGMGLEQVVKAVQYGEEAGQARGEERVPVHTVPYNSTILHASHLILATSSSRVFLRPPGRTLNLTPPLSPSPSLTTSQSSPPSSPSLSSLSLSDSRIISAQPTSNLPTPPPTQVSSHYVISTLDILSCLARTYHSKLTPPEGVHLIENTNDSGFSSFPPSGGGASLNPTGPQGKFKQRSKLRGSVIIMPGTEGPGGWELDPAGLSKRRRQSSFATPSAALPGQGNGGAQGQGGGAERAGGDGASFERWRWATRLGKT